jgi:hypothetical protein
MVQGGGGWQLVCGLRGREVLRPRLSEGALEGAPPAVQAAAGLRVIDTAVSASHAVVAGIMLYRTRSSVRLYGQSDAGRSRRLVQGCLVDVYPGA